MTLTELRYIIALDKERHFGRAAERSFVSQPTLSVALRKFEDQLGVTVFERQRGKVKPTPIGERIIEQARRVLAEAQLLESIASEGQDELSGRLRLGAIYTVGPYLLPRLIPELKQVAPNMPLAIEENYTSVLSAMLSRNELDLIIVAEPFSPAGVSTWALYDEAFVVAMPPQHPWAERASIGTSELADENLLLLGPGHCFRDQVIESCPDCAKVTDDEEPLAGGSLETIRHMVASGLGITVLPQATVNPDTDHGQLLTTRPFAGTPPTRRITLAWRRTFPRMQAIRAVHDAIVASQMQGVSWISDAQPSE
ncbi:MAG: hydrogen peroxide-inducible genes activator [Oceanococcus sp.]|nr:MAG: hydrogen peroxide-inducible genes activator [Oceanococcus sp.]